jgi:hypothetical protein
MFYFCTFRRFEADSIACCYACSQGSQMLLIERHVVGWEQAALTAVVAKPPVFVRKFLFTVSKQL